MLSTAQPGLLPADMKEGFAIACKGAVMLAMRRNFLSTSIDTGAPALSSHAEVRASASSQG